MERITTDRLEYFQEIRKGLLDTSSLNDQKPVFIYCEVGQLLTHGYSIHFLMGETNGLLIKEWDAAYDSERFRLGIFNLDRLKIIERYISLSQEESAEINNLLKLYPDIIKLDRIVLDGLFCEFIFKELTLCWNTEQEMNPGLSGLVSFIKRFSPAGKAYLEKTQNEDNAPF